MSNYAIICMAISVVSGMACIGFMVLDHILENKRKCPARLTQEEFDNVTRYLTITGSLLGIALGSGLGSLVLMLMQVAH